MDLQYHVTDGRVIELWEDRLELELPGALFDTARFKGVVPLITLTQLEAAVVDACTCDDRFQASSVCDDRSLRVCCGLVSHQCDSHRNARIRPNDAGDRNADRFRTAHVEAWVFYIKPQLG